MRLSRRLPLPNTSPQRGPNPPLAVTNGVWAVSRSLATTCEITVVFFSSAYLDVSVQRVHFPYGMTNLQLAGLPHSEISGSMCICHSPKLIAAYHVFLRLQEPRHPPYALNYFLFSWANSGPTYLYSLLQPQMSEEALWRVYLLLDVSIARNISLLLCLFQYVKERSVRSQVSGCSTKGATLDPLS